ncbi:MAG: class I SAM-dependent methyltransferase [Myxococcota bacterium]
MTRASISDDQAQLYFERADEYDELVSAEDADDNLRRSLRATLPPGTIADIGAGTGRIARLLAGHAERFVLVERAAPMLAIAETRLRALDLAFEAHCADARELPLANQSVDAAVAGWVFGHFRYWMPAGWQDEVDAALEEIHRVVRPGGSLTIIETLGTGYEEPRTHAALDEYFAHLEGQGFAREWVRTDYLFPTVEAAARVLGGFFGAEMADEIRQRGSARVPECTGIWRR